MIVLTRTSVWFAVAGVLFTILVLLAARHKGPDGSAIGATAKESL